MSLTLSTIARNRAGDALVGMIDEGTAHLSGYLEFYPGIKPTNPQTATQEDRLATIDFSNPSFTDFVNGEADANPLIGDNNLAATGVCSWFRVFNRDGIALWDGDVTITGGGGDIEFDNIKFIQGGALNLTSLTASVPE